MGNYFSSPSRDDKLLFRLVTPLKTLFISYYTPLPFTTLLAFAFVLTLACSFTPCRQKINAGSKKKNRNGSCVQETFFLNVSRLSERAPFYLSFMRNIRQNLGKWAAFVSGAGAAWQGTPLTMNDSHTNPNVKFLKI
jgi:hypothetical protein